MVLNRVGFVKKLAFLGVTVALVAAVIPTADANAALSSRQPQSELTLDWSALEAARPNATTSAVPAERVFGENRLETAVAIAQRSFPSGAGVVYLARADQFADALAAGTLVDGPILLVPSCGDLP